MSRAIAFPQRRQFVKTAMAAAAFAVGGLGATDAALAQASTWPAKPIRFVVGFAPGGVTDVMARAVAQSLGEALGQPVMVENKIGAGGNISVAEVIRAPADGYTFLVAPTTIETANPFLFKQTIQPATQLTPVMGIGRNQHYLVVKPQSPFKNAKELVAHGRANPGMLSYASSGPGTPPHLAGELFTRATGIVATHIPYRGSVPALQDILANQADYVFDPGLAFQHVRSGKVRMLAISSPTRSPFFPDVPTTGELGFPGAELDAWYGIWAPNGIPAELTARVAQEVAKVLTLPSTKMRYEASGAESIGMGNAEFRALLRNDTKKLSTLIKEAQINVE